jgi:hypothetical protein
MQITVNNDFSNGPRPFTQQEIDSFLQDEQTAVNILNSTFTNNISLTFNVGFGSFEGKPMAPTDGGFGDVNIQTAVGLPYSQLRANLLTFGQPGFFNAANLPAGDSINGISDFWVSSSVAAAFGLAAPNRPPDAPDGFIGINIVFAPGAQRIVAFLHEFGHAMGRAPNNFDADPEGVLSSELDLVRFVSPGNRLFDGCVRHRAVMSDALRFADRVRLLRSRLLIAAMKERRQQSPIGVRGDTPQSLNKEPRYCGPRAVCSDGRDARSELWTV